MRARMRIMADDGHQIGSMLGCWGAEASAEKVFRQ